MSFVDWETFARLNQQSQTADLEAQMEKLRQQGGEAGHLLNQSRWDAQQQQMREGQQGFTDTQLSNVGSYTDYLKAKDNMRQQLTQLMSGTGGDYGLLQQQILGGGMGEEARRMFGEIQNRESRYGYEVAQSASGTNRLADETRAREEKARSEAESRQQTDAANRNAFQQTLKDRMSQAWAQRDKDASAWWKHLNPFGAGPGNRSFGMYGNVGGFSSEGQRRTTPDQWGLDMQGADADRLAQMARAQGLGDEANRFQSDAEYVFGQRKKGGY